MRVATLAPMDLAHPALTVSTVHAGGVGVLDAVHCRGARAALAAATLARCVAQVDAGGPPALGLRLTEAQVAAHPVWLAALAGRPHWILLDQWSPKTLARTLAQLVCDGREVWVEVGDGLQIAAVDPSWPFAGWAAKGAECGGLAGTESAFVLAQRLARQPKPFLVRGGIGVQSAAACLAAGAHAVVLDDVLWLLRESPLPAEWRHVIARLGLTDTTCAGGALGLPVRVIDRPDAPAGRWLVAEAARLEAAVDGADGAAQWRDVVAAGVRWDDPRAAAWPVGEGIGRAAAVAARYRSVSRLVSAVTAAARAHVAAAARTAPLAEGGPLAAAIGTRYPIVQGPMTRVSDTAGFAAAVGGAGALPMLALALMRGPDVARLLAETAEAMAGRPWGVGVLGFVPPGLRREQMAVVERVRPPFALISGGRPDQAATLEALGIATFLHVPAPLLRPFLAQGARRFVFEGGECGGHVGPLHSFALWDYAVETLADAVTEADAATVQVLFAGGIHDALSAAMVAALAAPLAARGMQIGVLMGTAYLLTSEAVSAGAITPAFQHAAATSDGTVTITTGPGHVIRCAATPFVESFAERRASLVGAGVSGEALSEALDALVVGRARLASKGLERVGEHLVPVDEARQTGEGLYMLGSVAALARGTTTIAALHEGVSSGGTTHLVRAAGAPRPAAAAPVPRPADVAIIGVSCLVPGARDVETFWRHLLEQRSALTEIPRERWDWRLYYDPQPGARDRISSKWGGFVDPIPFEPRRFGIPPKSLPAISPSQLLALELVRRALVDAGFDDAQPDAAVRARTAVVFGTGNTADLEQLYMTRATLPLVLPDVSEDILRRLPEWTEESYPGQLAAVVAGRVANRFDFGGPNLTIDAACASSLAALDVAVRELVDGRSDLAIAGGLDFEMSPQAFLGFSHTRALSPTGRAAVFDRAADGIVISEGGVVAVLKRLADAERDGDRIYAVIKGVAASSDGRGLSMTAPKSEGQQRALERAYGRSGVDPGSLRLYEAHGTGTKVGDAAEAETIGRVLEAAGTPAGACVIGSAKSLIGHTRTAAGLVAMLKAALALHHRVLPPHGGVTRPLPAVGGDDRPLALLDAPRPWLPAAGVPRRAGASAFGFGGTNYHVVLEEHRPRATELAGPPGGASWPAELFVVAAGEAAGLRAGAERLARAAGQLEAVPADGSVPRRFTLRDLAYTCAVEARDGGTHRLAIVAGSAADLRARLGQVLTGGPDPLAEADGVRVGTGAPAGSAAWLFPGQGSQTPGMGRELATYCEALREEVAAVDALTPVAGRLWPPAAFDEAARERQRRALARTDVAQPAIGAVSCGVLDLLRSLGLAPAAVAGHSFGEFVALHAAGAVDRASLRRLAVARGRAMAGAGAEAGTMAMVGLAEEAVAPYLAAAAGVVVANRNTPAQTVISGPSSGVEQVVARVRADGHTAVPLTVSGAFHSPLMAPARPALADAIALTRFAAPEVPVHANLDGRPYPGDRAAMAARLVDHLAQRVDFVAQVEQMYAAGVRTFVEVGPGRVLCGLVTRTLGDRPHLAVPTDGGVAGLLDAVAALFVAGYALDPSRLFDGRDVSWVELDRLPPPPPSPTWFLDGGHVWPAGATTRAPGVAPLLDRESVALAPRSVVAPSALDGIVLPAGATDGPLVEIYREYERTMRHFLDQQERMLARVLGTSEDGAAAGVPARPDEWPDVVPPRAPAAPRLAADAGGPPDVSRDGLAGRLVRIVADRTGYGDDAIGRDLDLEAELGIDSIKRIEIIGTFASSLPEAYARRLQTELDRLTRLRTLNAIAEASAGALDGVADRVAPGDPVAAGGDVARFVMCTVPAPAADVPARRVSGLHLVTDDGGGVAATVRALLTARGAVAGRVPADALTDAAEVARVVGQLRAAHGPVRGVLHLAALGRPPVDGGTAAWLAEAGVTTRGLFLLLKAAAADLEASADAAVIAATALGGDFGRRGCRPGAEMAGGCHGLLRAFEREYPDVAALVVDVDDGRPADEIAGQIVREFLTPSAREVGYSAAGRVTTQAVAAPLDDRVDDIRVSPQAGWVVLATGGARGITAEVCQELAAPGVRFVLVGRGVPGDGAAPDDERRRTAAALTALGAEVEFVQADVADAAAFGAAIDDLYRRHGRIDAVLHGAGVIADQRFALKPVASFDRVFDTKVGSTVTLGRHLRGEGLRWVILFGSVSGRFGNPGQTDYAAANEVLNRLAWSLGRQWPDTRVVTINWGPWRGPGMMSDATLALVEARGIAAIERPAGRRFVARELGAGTRDEAEVVAGDGPWRDATGSPSERRLPAAD